MPWLQLVMQTDSRHTDSLEDALLALGAQAITLADNADQPLFEPPPGATPLWDQIRLCALFDAEANQDALIHGLRTQTNIEPFPDYRFEALEDKDWQREWMEHYHPMQFGERLWVCPSWQPIPDPNAVNLLLDPGLAFGTGTHPTTALCLRWLDSLPLEGRSVTDFGCGSGILAIAAALLGANEVVGIDNDPQALIATRANAERNQVADRVQAYAPRHAPTEPTDYLVANILAGPLIELVEVMHARVKPGGNIALSGILASQRNSLISCYERYFQIDDVAQEEDWLRIIATKKP